MIGYDRFAELLGAIPVGRTGRSFVLAPTGAILIAADAPSAPRNAAMDPVAHAAGRRVAARSGEGRDISESARIIVDGAAYAIGLSPLWYEGWQLAGGRARGGVSARSTRRPKPAEWTLSRSGFGTMPKSNRSRASASRRRLCASATRKPLRGSGGPIVRSRPASCATRP